MKNIFYILTFSSWATRYSHRHKNNELTTKVEILYFKTQQMDCYIIFFFTKLHQFKLSTMIHFLVPVVPVALYRQW